MKIGKREFYLKEFFNPRLLHGYIYEPIEKEKSDYHLIEYSAYAEALELLKAATDALVDCHHTLENSTCDMPDWSKGSQKLAVETITNIRDSGVLG